MCLFIVAQVSNIFNLPYRRFPIGRPSAPLCAADRMHDPQAGSPAIHRVGNLRYLGSTSTATRNRSRRGPKGYALWLAAVIVAIDGGLRAQPIDPTASFGPP